SDLGDGNDHLAAILRFLHGVIRQVDVIALRDELHLSIVVSNFDDTMEDAVTALCIVQDDVANLHFACGQVLYYGDITGVERWIHTDSADQIGTHAEQSHVEPD